MTTTIKLTQYAKGAGCGCKISPAILEQMLNTTRSYATKGLLIGNATNDDAAVYDLQNGTALVITADFFMPIVDDAFTFGQVAAANAISDVYAMGATPITAIAILGWPIDKLSAELAALVLEGARNICEQAGIVISGGHTIDAPEPFFGLSVNGIVAKENIKQNNTSKTGDSILLTKPIGVGILATAQKRGLLKEEDYNILISQLIELNFFGQVLGKEKDVHAMTDVTGFGLLGHLVEMSEGANLTAKINYHSVPKIAAAIAYAKQGVVPDATYRNWNAYEKKVLINSSVDAMESFTLLPDPQTNGGLLISVKPSECERIKALATSCGMSITEIGVFVNKEIYSVIVE